MSTTVGTERFCWYPAQRESASVSSLEVTCCPCSAVGSHGLVQTVTWSCLLRDGCSLSGFPTGRQIPHSVPQPLRFLSHPSCSAIRLLLLRCCSPLCYPAGSPSLCCCVQGHLGTFLPVHSIALTHLPGASLSCQHFPAWWPHGAVVLPWLTPSRHLLVCGGSFGVLNWEGHLVSGASDVAKPPPMPRMVPTTRNYPFQG